MAGEVRLTFDPDGRPVFVPVRFSLHDEEVGGISLSLDAEEDDEGGLPEFWVSMFGDDGRTSTVPSSLVAHRRFTHERTREEKWKFLDSTAVELCSRGCEASTAVELGSRGCDRSQDLSLTASPVTASMFPHFIPAPVELCSRSEVEKCKRTLPEARGPPEKIQKSSQEKKITGRACASQRGLQVTYVGSGSGSPSPVEKSVERSSRTMSKATVELGSRLEPRSAPRRSAHEVPREGKGKRPFFLSPVVPAAKRRANHGALVIGINDGASDARSRRDTAGEIGGDVPDRQLVGSIEHGSHLVTARRQGRYGDDARRSGADARRRDIPHVHHRPQVILLKRGGGADDEQQSGVVRSIKLVERGSQRTDAVPPVEHSSRGDLSVLSVQAHLPALPMITGVCAMDRQRARPSRQQQHVNERNQGLHGSMIGLAEQWKRKESRTEVSVQLIQISVWDQVADVGFLNGGQHGLVTNEFCGVIFGSIVLDPVADILRRTDLEAHLILEPFVDSTIIYNVDSALPPVNRQLAVEQGGSLTAEEAIGEATV